MHLMYIGIAPVINGIAAVIMDGLTCEVVYTILAGGTINGVLVGPTSSYGTIVSGPCPITITPVLSPSYGMEFIHYVVITYLHMYIYMITVVLQFNKI